MRALFLAFALIGSARAQAPADSLRWLGAAELAIVEESVELAAGQRDITLRRPAIVEILTVELDRAPLRANDDYRFISIASVLRLGLSAPAGSRLLVRYRYDPLGAVAQHWLHDPAARMPSESSAPDSSASARARKQETLFPGQNLRVSGSKTVSVQGGTNREATVDQALRLSVQGQLTEGMHVRAEISDENLPITPEGNTEELSDLDQVRIELYGQRGKVLLGDFVTRSQVGAFVPYERKLQGMSLRGVHDATSVSLLAGAPEGERVEREFRGIEGVQGPYELLDGGRVNQIFIVAGSERVWLDGELLTRGEDRDYTIDYVRGTIRFSERRAIGTERRVAVDFETSRSGYSRSVLGASVDSLRFLGLATSMFLLREADDPDRPTDGSLSASDRDSLALAGDDSRRARGQGVVATAPGQGHYLERFENGERYFVFADSSGGDFDLFFTRVEPGSGDYVLDRVGNEGVPEYRWVGAGLGDHRIGRTLALPESRRLAGLSLRRGQRSNGGWLSAEVNWSSFDRNQLSGRDDADNDDVAWRAEGVTPWLGDEATGLRLSARAEAIGRDFASTGRLRAPFFYDRWNLQSDVRDVREGIEEAQLQARWSGRESDFEVAHLHRSQRYDGLRGGWRVRSPLFADLGYEHDLSFIDAEREAGRKSSRRDRSATLKWSARLSPHLRIYDEEFRDRRSLRSFGFRAKAYELGTGWDAGKDLSARMKFTRQEADSLASDGGGWRFARDSRRIESGGNWRRGSFSAALDAHLRDTRVPGDTFERARLGTVRLAHRDPSSSSGFDLSYRAGTDQSRVQKREILFVGIGEGDYDAEGHPVGVRQGDYMVVFTPSDSLLRATDVELQATLDLALPFFGGGLLARGLLQLRERNRSDDLLSILRLSPSLLRDPETTVHGEQRLRQELDFLRGVRGHDLQLSFEERLLLDQRFLQGAESAARRLRELRYEVVLGAGFNMRSEVGHEHRERRAPDSNNPLLGSYRSQDLRFASTLRWRADARRQLSLGAGFTRREENLNDIRQRIFEILPRAEAPLLGGRWAIDLRWAEIREDSPGVLLRPFFFEAPGSSRRLGLNAQWELGASFTVGMRYQLRDESQRILRHDLSLETRARF